MQNFTLIKGNISNQKSWIFIDASSSQLVFCIITYESGKTKRHYRCMDSETLISM